MDEKQKNQNTIEVYFNEIIGRDHTIVENVQKKKHIEGIVAEKQKQLDDAENRFNQAHRDITNKTNQIKHNGVIEKLLLEKSNKANREMNNNLTMLGEREFEKYLNLNDNIVKNMIRLHGTNNLNNIFKLKKQKFVEKVIQDHLFKKNKMGEFIRGMFYHEEIIKSFQLSISSTEEIYKAVSDNLYIIIANSYQLM